MNVGWRREQNNKQNNHGYSALAANTKHTVAVSEISHDSSLNYIVSYVRIIIAYIVDSSYPKDKTNPWVVARKYVFIILLRI